MKIAIHCPVGMSANVVSVIEVQDDLAVSQFLKKIRADALALFRHGETVGEWTKEGILVDRAEYMIVFKDREVTQKLLDGNYERTSFCD